jgi:hypothetical protein
MLLNDTNKRLFYFNPEKSKSFVSNQAGLGIFGNVLQIDTN